MELLLLLYIIHRNSHFEPTTATKKYTPKGFQDCALLVYSVGGQVLCMGSEQACAYLVHFLWSCTLQVFECLRCMSKWCTTLCTKVHFHVVNKLVHVLCTSCGLVHFNCLSTWFPCSEQSCVCLVPVNEQVFDCCVYLLYLKVLPRIVLDGNRFKRLWSTYITLHVSSFNPCL